jgi:hypothetical protein
VTVREVEKRSFLMNFVPFGAGQFQQGRTRLGTLFAATQGALAVTSIISYFAYNGLVETKKVVVDDLQGPKEVPVSFISTENVPQARTWTRLKFGSAAGFYAVYAAGVADALIHHQDQVVVDTRIETLPASAPPPEPRESTPDPTLRARLHVYPTPGGAGAGFTLAF